MISRWAGCRLAAGRFLLAASVVSAAGCGARSSPYLLPDAAAGRDSSETDSGEWPFVPGHRAGQCCLDRPDLVFSYGNSSSTACGDPFHQENLVENCGGQPIPVSVLVELRVGEEGEGPVVASASTSPGMPAGTGEWLVFDVGAEEWTATALEYGNRVRGVIDPDDAVAECDQTNNGHWNNGPECP